MVPTPILSSAYWYCLRYIRKFLQKLTIFKLGIFKINSFLEGKSLLLWVSSYSSLLLNKKPWGSINLVVEMSLNLLAEILCDFQSWECLYFETSSLSTLLSSQKLYAFPRIFKVFIQNTFRSKWDFSFVLFFCFCVFWAGSEG